MKRIVSLDKRGIWGYDTKMGIGMTISPERLHKIYRLVNLVRFNCSNPKVASPHWYRFKFDPVLSKAAIKSLFREAKRYGFINIYTQVTNKMLTKWSCEYVKDLSAEDLDTVTLFEFSRHNYIETPARIRQLGFYLQKHPDTSDAEIMKIMGISRSTLYRYLAHLKIFRSDLKSLQTRNKVGRPKSNNLNLQL